MKQPWSRQLVEDTSHNEHPVSTTKPKDTELRPPFRPSTCINRHQHAVLVNMAVVPHLLSQMPIQR